MSRNESPATADGLIDTSGIVGGGGDFNKSDEPFLDNDGGMLCASEGCINAPVTDIRTSICGVDDGPAALVA